MTDDRAGTGERAGSDPAAGSDGRATTTRRTLLAAAGAAGAGALAGCVNQPQAQFRIAVDAAERSPLEFRFGYNTNLLGWSVGFDGLQREVEQSNAQVLRFPGGDVSTLYDWEADRFLSAPLEWEPSAVVDREGFDSTAAYESAVDSYAAFRDRLRDRLARADEGTYGQEGFLEVTEAAGADRVLVLNLATAPDDRDPVAHAADWVRDLADREVAVQRFELGHELYGPAGFLADRHRPGAYLDAARELTDVVRSAFPDAAVAVVGAPSGRPGLDDARARRYEQFNAAVSAADFYDAVTAHTAMDWGYRDGEPLATSAKAFRRARAGGLRTATSLPADWAGTLAEQLDAPVWMTETGTDLPAPYNGTMLQATVEVTYLLEWLDEAGTAPLYCKHQLFGDRYGTVLSAEGDGLDRFTTPLYHAYAFVGDALASATHAVPTAVENVFATDTDRPPWRGLVVRGLVDADAGRLYCPFVNRTPTTQQFELAVEGADLPSDRRGGMRWVSAAPRSANTADDPTGVTPAYRSFKVGRPTELPQLATGVFSVEL